MFSLKGMNRWIAPPLAALIMAGSVIPAVFAATSAVPLAVLSCEKTLGRPAHKPPPPGQLKRRGVVGEIIGVDADAGTIMIGTKFGGVEIEVPKDFVVSDDLLGSRTAVLTAKELKDIDDESDGVLGEDVSTDEGTFVDDTGEGATDEGTSADDTGEAAADEGTSADGTDEAAADEGTSGDGTGEGATDEGTSDDPIRTASALKITIIPTVSTITHEQAVVVATTEGSVEVIDEDGEVGDVDITDSGDATGEEAADDGTSEGDDGITEEASSDGPTTESSTSDENASDGDTTSEDGSGAVEEGDDVVLLTECTHLGATPKVRALQSGDKIAQRLERLRTKIEGKFADDPEKLARFEDLIQKRQENLEARLERIADKAPDKFKSKAAKALGKARGECTDDECPDDGGGGPPTDRGSGKSDEKGDGKGKSDDKGGSKGGGKGKSRDKGGSKGGGKKGGT